jgi:hypothetical protein
MTGPLDESLPLPSLGGPAGMYAADAAAAAHAAACSAGDARQGAVDAGRNARTAKQHADTAVEYSLASLELVNAAQKAEASAAWHARRARIILGLTFACALIAIAANFVGSAVR